MINLLIFFFRNCDFCVILKNIFLFHDHKKSFPNFLWSVLNFYFTFTFKTIWILFLRVMWNIGQFFYVKYRLFQYHLCITGWECKLHHIAEFLHKPESTHISRLSIYSINPFLYTFVVLIMNILWILIFVKWVIVHSFSSSTPTEFSVLSELSSLFLALCFFILILE